MTAKNDTIQAENDRDAAKAALLSTVVEHIDITSFDARPIVEAMAKMSFTSRDLARATDIFNTMLSDPDATVFLTIAGSTSAVGSSRVDLQACKLEYSIVSPK